MASDYVEFYVTCNPPLSSSGLSSLLKLAHDSLVPDKAVEILVETSPPWIKVIASTSLQCEVSSWFEAQLEEILEAESSLLPERQQDLIEFGEDDEGEEEEEADDVVIASSEDPPLITWPVFKRAGYWGRADHEPFQYPEIIRYVQYKAIWDKLEKENLTMAELSARYQHFGLGDTGDSQRFLSMVSSCTIAYNLRGNILYIGSDYSQECVDNAIRKLNNLLDFCNSKIGTRHVFFPETENPVKITYRYLSHVGLAHSTFVNHYEENDFDYERQKIIGSMTFRTATQSLSGEWVDDQTVYPLGRTPKPNLEQTFSPFENYHYASKQSRAALLASTRDTGRSNISKIAPTSLNLPNTSKGNLPEEVSQGSLQPRSPTLPTHAPQDLSSYSVDFLTDQCDQIKTEISSHKPDIIDDDYSIIANDPAAISNDETIDYKIIDWMKDVEKIQLDSPSVHKVQLDSPSVEKAQSETIHGHLLVSFHQSPKKTSQSPAIAETPLVDYAPGEPVSNMSSHMNQSSLFHRPVTPKPVQDLLSETSPVRVFRGMFGQALSPTTQPEINSLGNDGVYPQAAEHPSEDLLDAPYAAVNFPALMDEAGYSVPGTNSEVVNTESADNAQASEDPFVTFGRHEDAPNQFYNTMYQRASCDKRTWANVAGDRQKKSLPSTEFGINVKVTSVPQRKKPEQGSGAGTTSYSISSQSKAPTLSRDTVIESQNAGVLKVLKTGSKMNSSKALGHDETLKVADGQLTTLSRALCVIPGRLQLEAKFGRLCVKNQHESNINIGKGPRFSADQVLDSLYDKGFNEKNVCFCTTLTAHGMDADSIPQTRLLGGAAWHLLGTQVFYDFRCKSARYGTVTVEVDAETFSYRCINEMQELSCVYIHCLKRAWDVKVSLSCCEDTGLSDGCETSKFVDSLRISPHGSQKDKGSITIEADQKTNLGEVKGVKVRHIATYKNFQSPQSHLKVTMTRMVRFAPNHTQTTYCGILDPGSKLEGNASMQTFEASIVSTRAQEFFKENANMSFGDKASWDPDTLSKHSVFKAVCEPAMTMVSQMDHVGSHNNNGSGPRVGEKNFNGNARNLEVFW